VTHGVWTSPFQMSFADYQGRVVTISVPFNESTLAIVNPGLSGNRDVGCVYNQVMVGRPDGTMKTFAIPEGAFSVGRAQLANQGFSTIDVLAEANVTVGTA